MTKFRPLLTLAGLALATLTPLASAQTYVEYSTSLSISADTNEFAAHEGETPIGPMQAAISVPGFGSASGVANVTPGANKAGFEVHGTDASNPVAAASAFSSSRYYDWFTIDDPELNGTIGTFTTTLFVDGSGDFRVDDSITSNPDTLVDARWLAVINVSADGLVDEDGFALQQAAVFDGEWFKDYTEIELNYFGDPLSQYQQEATFEFIYGQPVFIDNALQTILTYDNQVLAPGTFDVNVDLSHSAYWAGLREVRDASGNRVSGFAFESGSGFDYRFDATPGAVPEPASMAVLALGFGALLRRRAKEA